MTTNTPDTDTLRTVFGTYPTGVVAVCGLRSGEQIGMVMSTFIPVSLTPPLVAVCVQRTSKTWPVLRTVPVLGVSVLAHYHERAARALAARTGDRFAGIDTTVSDGAVHIVDSVAQLTCSVDNETHAGDHTLALLRVRTLQSTADTDPLVFYRSAFTHIAADRRFSAETGTRR